IPFDPQVARAIVARRPAVELGGPASEAIKDLWAAVQGRLFGKI
ncbi:MAG: (4Fe-4S)-binding protein, partial [Methanosarcinales archaeon]|nr:(4Fe-4S)-binding protein [Methanosarcinales archaeon]